RGVRGHACLLTSTAPYKDGWSESDTHHISAQEMMGIASLHPSYETRFRDLAAHCVRGLHLGCPPREERAQGRPGACCTRGLACDLRKQKCTRAYRAAGAFRPSLRNGFTAYSALSPVNGSFATVAPKKLASRELDASTAGVRTTRLNVQRFLWVAENAPSP